MIPEPPTPAADVVEYPFDVFISYAHADLTIAQAFVDIIRANGVKVNWDRDFPFGDDASMLIGDAVAQSRRIVVLLSRQSSQRPWISVEAWAFHKVVPVFIDDVREEDVLIQLRNKVPASLRGWDGKSLTDVLVKLIAQLKRTQVTNPNTPILTPAGAGTSTPALATTLPPQLAPQPSAPGPATGGAVVASGTGGKTLPRRFGVLAAAAVVLVACLATAGGLYVAKQARVPSSFPEGRCNFVGRARAIEIRGPKDAKLSVEQVFSAPYAQEVNLPDVWLQGIKGGDVQQRRGPGVRVVRPRSLTPVLADDQAFDVRYEVTADKSATWLKSKFKQGGQNGEVDGLEIYANKELLASPAEGADPWSIAVDRPFEVDVKLAPTADWPGGKAPVIAGPFAAVTHINLIDAEGTFECAPSAKGPVTVEWNDSHDRLYVEELTVDGDALHVNIRSPLAPTRSAP